MSRFAAISAAILFGSALFFSSALLMMMQPMVGRTLLPHLGGNAIAWNACLVFFQATLLAGYFYADLAHRFRGLRWQPLVQLALIFFAMLLCFVGVCGEGMLATLAPRLTGLDTWPIVTTFSLLIVAVALPFVALAALGPFVQRWFAHLDHPKAIDPYFLFVASNLGGLVALVTYVLVIEPFTPLYAQWLSWKLAVTALGVLVFLTAFTAWLSPRSLELEPTALPRDPNVPALPTLIGRGPATWGRRLHWLLASAVPVALLMAMTDRLSLDVGSAPLLWAVPLGLFLLAFAQAYMRCSPLGYGPLAARAPLHVLLGLGLAVALGIALIMLLSGRGAAGQEHGLLTIACGAVFAFIMMTPTVWLTALQPFVVMLVIFVDGNMFVTSLGRVSSPFLVLHLTGFYWSSRVCFGALAADRPAASAVTGYYAWIGVGGLVGGACQLLLVPMLFRNYLEFAFLAALATTLRTAWLPYGVTDWLLGFVAARNKDEAKAATVRHRLAIAFDLAFAVALATAAGLLFHARSLVAPFPPIRGNLNAFVRDAVAGFNDYPLVAALVAPVFLLARPWRCGLVLAAIAALCVIEQESQRKERVVERQRNAFGSLKVVEDTRRVGANVQAIPGGLTERRLVQGTTMQGAAFTSPKELGRMPTTYYHRKGPVGKIMSAMEWFREPGANIRNDPEFWLRQNVDNAKDDARIITSLVGNGVALGQAPLGVVVTPWSEPPYAFIGLGAGNLFAYARPLQIVDAYELDAAVIDLSKRVSPAFPHYKAAKERGVQVEIIAGDARRSLALTRADGFYTAIFVDAFNSASIPTHLLTVEAIELYFQKLTGDGIICFHISNRHVELKGVLDKAAQKLKVPLFEMKGGDTEPDIGFEPSHWVCLTRNESMQRRWHTAGFFPQGGGPVRPAVPPPREAWTDEHANVLDAIHPSAGWTRFVYAVLIMILLMALCVGAIEVVFAALPRSMEPRAPSAS